MHLAKVVCPLKDGLVRVRAQCGERAAVAACYARYLGIEIEPQLAEALIVEASARAACDDFAARLDVRKVLLREVCANDCYRIDCIGACRQSVGPHCPGVK